MDPRSTNFVSTYSSGSLSIGMPPVYEDGDVLIVFLISIGPYWGGTLGGALGGQNPAYSVWQHIHGNPAPPWPVPPDSTGWPPNPYQPWPTGPIYPPYAPSASVVDQRGFSQWSVTDPAIDPDPEAMEWHYYGNTWSNLGSEDPGRGQTLADHAVFDTWPFVQGDTYGDEFPFDGATALSRNDSYSIDIVARTLGETEPSSFTFTLNNPLESYDYRALAFVFPPNELGGNYFSSIFIDGVETWWQKELNGQRAWWPSTNWRSFAELATQFDGAATVLSRSEIDAITIPTTGGQIFGELYDMIEFPQFAQATIVCTNDGPGAVRVTAYSNTNPDLVHGHFHSAFVNVPAARTRTLIARPVSSMDTYFRLMFERTLGSDATSVTAEISFMSDDTVQVGQLWYPTDAITGRPVFEQLFEGGEFTVPTLEDAVGSSRALVLTLYRGRLELTDSGISDPGTFTFSWSTGQVDVRDYEWFGTADNFPLAWTLAVPSGATGVTISHSAAGSSTNWGCIKQTWYSTLDTAHLSTSATMPAYLELGAYSGWGPLDPVTQLPYVVDPSSPNASAPAPPPDALNDDYIIGLVIYGGPTSLGDPSGISIGDPSALPPVTSLPVLHHETWTVEAGTVEGIVEDISKSVLVVGTHASANHAVDLEGTGIVNLRARVFTADGGPIAAPYPTMLEPNALSDTYNRPTKYIFGRQMVFRVQGPPLPPVAVPSRLATIVG